MVAVIVARMVVTVVVAMQSENASEGANRIDATRRCP
jgi:hypothetical protein